MILSIDWRPEIGDPTWIGWLTVVGYISSAWFTAKAGMRVRQQAIVRPGDSPTLWFSFALVLLFLGLNKQLDVQTLFMQVGREIALAQNWYEQRRLVQFLFFGMFGSVILGATLFLAWKRRSFFKQHPFALLGILWLVSYILLRSALIDHVEEMAGLKLEDTQWPAVLEMSGIVSFIVACARQRSSTFLPCNPRTKAPHDRALCNESSLS